MMIKIQFNEEIMEIDDNLTLTELLTIKNYTDHYFAVAVNKKFVPRSGYTQVYMNQNDVIDIIIPMQGG